MQSMKKEQHIVDNESLWISWDEELYSKFRVANNTTAKVKAGGSKKYYLMALPKRDLGKRKFATT